MIATLRSIIPVCLLVLLALASCRTMDEDLVDPSSMTQADFATADLDSDGKLTMKELATFQHREALAEFDLDSDGNISAKEWAVARPSAGEDDPHFKALDQNSDRMISEKEAVGFITKHQGFTEQFDDLDENADSALHWEEVDAGAPDSLKVNLFSADPAA